MRNGGTGFQFDADTCPSTSDSDFSGSSSADVYYVDAYAVSIGRNTSDSTTYYSSVLHLGSVPIRKEWY